MLPNVASGNEFQWRNLYIHRFGSCAYPPLSGQVGDGVRRETTVGFVTGGGKGGEQQAVSPRSRAQSICRSLIVASQSDGNGGPTLASLMAKAGDASQSVHDVVTSVLASPSKRGAQTPYKSFVERDGLPWQLLLTGGERVPPICSSWQAAYRTRSAWRLAPFEHFFVLDSGYGHAQVVAAILLHEDALRNAYERLSLQSTVITAQSPRMSLRFADSANDSRNNVIAEMLAKLPGSSVAQFEAFVEDVVLLYEKRTRSTMEMLVDVVDFYLHHAAYHRHMGERDYATLFTLMKSPSFATLGQCIDHGIRNTRQLDEGESMENKTRQFASLAHPILSCMVIVTSYLRLHGSAWCRPIVYSLINALADPELRLYIEIPPPPEPEEGDAEKLEKSDKSTNPYRRGGASLRAVQATTKMRKAAKAAAPTNAPLPPIKPTEEEVKDQADVCKAIVAAFDRFSEILQDAPPLPAGIRLLLTRFCLHVNLSMVEALLSATDRRGLLTDPLTKERLQEVMALLSSREGTDATKSENPMVRDVKQHRVAKYLLFQCWLLPIIGNAQRYGLLPPNVSTHTQRNMQAFVAYFSTYLAAPFANAHDISLPIDTLMHILPSGRVRVENERHQPTKAAAPVDTSPRRRSTKWGKSPMKQQPEVPPPEDTDSFFSCFSGLFVDDVTDPLRHLNRAIGVTAAAPRPGELEPSWAPSTFGPVLSERIGNVCWVATDDFEDRRVVEEFRVPTSVEIAEAANVFRQVSTLSSFLGQRSDTDLDVAPLGLQSNLKSKALLHSQHTRRSVSRKSNSHRHSSTVSAHGGEFSFRETSGYLSRLKLCLLSESYSALGEQAVFDRLAVKSTVEPGKRGSSVGEEMNQRSSLAGALKRRRRSSVTKDERTNSVTGSGQEGDQKDQQRMSGSRLSKFSPKELLSILGPPPTLDGDRLRREAANNVWPLVAEELSNRAQTIFEECNDIHDKQWDSSASQAAKAAVYAEKTGKRVPHPPKTPKGNPLFVGSNGPDSEVTSAWRRSLNATAALDSSGIMSPSISPVPS